jgi:hypothetical protein
LDQGLGTAAVVVYGTSDAADTAPPCAVHPMARMTVDGVCVSCLHSAAECAAAVMDAAPAFEEDSEGASVDGVCVDRDDAAPLHAGDVFLLDVVVE